MKNHSSPSLCTFEQLNEELNDFYKYLKDNKYTDDKIRKIFAPLVPTSTLKVPKRAVFILAPLMLLLVLFFATHVETLSWHLSAIGRILLIKLLPFWDWTVLKNERCLIQKPSLSTLTTDVPFNCDLCENVQQIDVYNDISPDFLKNRYLDVGTPVIIKQTFPKPDFLEDLLQNSIIASSKPCKLSTNIFDTIPTVKNLILKTDLFDSFFLHFQNCDFEVMKQFRQFAPRPPFLPPELSPVQYNWLLLSQDYNVTNFKSIGLVEKVAVMWQVSGGNFVRLAPRNNCEGECPVIEVKLGANEAIVVGSLWNLEYRPVWGRNVAVVVELH